MPRPKKAPPETITPAALSDAKGEVVDRPKGSVDLSNFNNGKGFKHKATGVEFGLNHQPADPHGDTHHLKNENKYWSGTESEFKNEFEKA